MHNDAWTSPASPVGEQNDGRGAGLSYPIFMAALVRNDVTLHVLGNFRNGQNR